MQRILINKLFRACAHIYVLNSRFNGIFLILKSHILSSKLVFSMILIKTRSTKSKNNNLYNISR